MLEKKTVLFFDNNFNIYGESVANVWIIDFWWYCYNSIYAVMYSSWP